MIYLDYNATTPIDPQVAKAMLPFIQSQFGNPGSGHEIGLRAKAAVDKARDQVAELLGANPSEVIFTGCATEANNLAIKGVAEASKNKGRHIIATTVEHPAVIEPLKFLAERGWEVTLLPVDHTGLVSADSLAEAIRDDTVLVSVMHANNETGTIMPIEKFCAIAHEKGALFHTDAAQSVGKIKTDVGELGVDLLTVAGHKFYGPKGVGALYVKTGTPIAPIFHGGGQESGLRSGTENVIHIVALGEAAQVAGERLIADGERIRELRDLLFIAIADKCPVRLIGHPELRLPNTLNLAFELCKGSRVLEGAPDVAAGTGAACHDRNVTLSPVLAAMKISPMIGRGAVRLSLGRFTTREEVIIAAQQLSRAAISAREKERD